MLCLINQEREHHGEGALATNAKLTRAAQAHSRDMANEDYFSHVAPNGETPLQRMRASGYLPNSQDGYVVGENIAWGTMWLATPQSIVSAWMASPGHRANILDGAYRETGVGVEPRPPASLAEGQPGALYTQDFGMIIPAGHSSRHVADSAPSAGGHSAHSSASGRSRAPPLLPLGTDNLRGLEPRERSNTHHGSSRRQSRHRHRVRARHRARHRRAARRKRRAACSSTISTATSPSRPLRRSRARRRCSPATSPSPACPTSSCRAPSTRSARIDIIVNNAGYTIDAPIHKMSDEQYQAMLDIHLVAPFRIIRAAAPHLREPAKKEREEGKEVFRKIVNISSISGTMGNAGQANYSSAKAGITGLTKTLAKEWGQFKVNVNAVAFGFIDTRLTAAKVEDNTMEIGGEKVQLGIPEQMRQMASMLIPLGRPGTPEEAAGGIFFLCSPWSNYVHGQVLNVTGGQFVGMTS